MRHNVIESGLRGATIGASICFLSPSLALTQSAGKPVAAVEDLRIRGVDHDISSFYGSKVIVFPHGAMAVVDEPNGRFVLFDAAGKKTMRFGRKGEGPGEFSASGGGTIRSPSGVSRPAPPTYPLTFGLTGDTAWVYHR